MTIRQIQATQTVPGPDPYSTPTTFTQGQILDIVPGSYFDTQLGGNAPALTSPQLTGFVTGSDSAATANA